MIMKLVSVETCCHGDENRRVYFDIFSQESDPALSCADLPFTPGLLDGK